MLLMVGNGLISFSLPLFFDRIVFSPFCSVFVSGVGGFCIVGVGARMEDWEIGDLGCLF